MGVALLLTSVASWLVVALLVVTVAVRFARLDTWAAGAAISAVAPVSLLASYPMLIFAAIARRHAIAATAVGAILVQLWWFYPLLPLVHDEGSLPKQAMPLRIMSANLLFDNGRAGSLSAEIAAKRPDVLALEEFSDQTASELRRTGVLNAFGYSAVRVTSGPSGIGLYSRLPLTNVMFHTIEGREIITAVLNTARGPVSLDVVHTIAPVDTASERQWRAQLAGLAALAATQRGLVVMVGDFNATDGNRPFAALKKRGHFADAFDAVGKGYAMTWPQNRRLLPPLVRPDHVLVGPGVVALRGQTLNNPGSDHRAILVDVGLRRR